MNINDINLIESKKDIKLPEFYKNALLNYPFETNSFGEYMLKGNVEEILSENESVIMNLTKPFIIGTDGGELSYFIDLGNEGSSVIYEYDIESGRYKVYSKDIEEYIEKIKNIDSDLKKEKQVKTISPKKQKKIEIFSTIIAIVIVLLWIVFTSK